MKALKEKIVIKVLTILMVFCMLFVAMPNLAYASEGLEYESEGTVLIEKENTEYYQRALTALGMTEEEANDCDIYVVDVDSSKIQTLGVTIPNNGWPYNFDEFSFSDTNNGAYWTCLGNRMKWGYFWHGTYDDEYELRLGVYLYQYPGGASNEIDHAWSYNGVSYSSDWLTVTPNTDYRFLYYCKYLTQSGTGYATVQMFVATKTV